MVIIISKATVMHRSPLPERDKMRFDNFTRATCILYIDLVETLNFLLRYKIGSESCTH